MLFQGMTVFLLIIEDTGINSFFFYVILDGLSDLLRYIVVRYQPSRRTAQPRYSLPWMYGYIIHAITVRILLY